MNGPQYPSARSQTHSRLLQIGFLVLLGLVWYLATTFGSVNRLVLPAPRLVLQELWSLLVSGAFIGDLMITLGELVAAVVIASVVGLTVGYLCSRTTYLVRVFDPLMASAYAIPSILLYPLLVLFFGIGPASKVAMGVLIATFPIMMATMAGFSSVEKVYQISARSMGANNRQMFFDVMLPGALPIISSGLRIGTIHACGGILAAEALASFGGLGHRIVNLSEQFNTPRMFAYVFIAIAMATVITFSAFAAEKRANRHTLGT